MMKELDDIKAELNLKSDENLVLANENVKLKESNKSKDKEIHTMKKEMKKVGEKQYSELVELREFKENTMKKEKERKLNVKLSKKSEIKKNAEVQTEVVGNTSEKEIQADIQ